MKVYISGPMTGLADYNAPVFNAAEKRLTAAGHVVLNPARHGTIVGYEWSDYMRLALIDLAAADGIHMLDSWQKSRGARLEYAIAKQLGFEVIS